MSVSFGDTISIKAKAIAASAKEFVSTTKGKVISLIALLVIVALVVGGVFLLTGNKSDVVAKDTTATKEAVKFDLASHKTYQAGLVDAKKVLADTEKYLKDNKAKMSTEQIAMINSTIKDLKKQIDDAATITSEEGVTSFIASIAKSTKNTQTVKTAVTASEKKKADEAKVAADKKKADEAAAAQAAEAEKQAAIEAAVNQGEGYVDEGGSYVANGGGGYVAGQTGNGGGGYVPPASGGGNGGGNVIAPPVEQPPAPKPPVVQPPVVVPPPVVQPPAHVQTFGSIAAARASLGGTPWVTVTAACSVAGSAFGSSLDGNEGGIQHAGLVGGEFGRTTGATYAPGVGGGTLTVYRCS